jgi:citrate lyase subunit beta/citryl-CoA lyase
MPPCGVDDAEARMRLRSLLFVPGDSERKFAKASGSHADALILDLEDAVAPTKKSEARTNIANLIDDGSSRSWAFFVRVNALDTGMTLDDMAAVVKPGLDGLVIPKANSAADVQRIANYLDALEVKAGMAQGTVKLVVVSTETPTAMFNLGSYIPVLSG